MALLVVWPQQREEAADGYSPASIRPGTRPCPAHRSIAQAKFATACGPRHPVLVAERDGAVVGWGSLNPFSPRPAYRYVADFSVYVERAARGSGVGRALLAALIAEARRLGYHKLVLAAFPFNAAGTALYRRVGFREVGVYREQGVLDGRWVDTVVMELLLDDRPPPAEPPGAA